MAKITDRLKRSWNAFFSRDPTEEYQTRYRPGYYVSGSRPDRFTLTPTNASTIIASIYNRIAVDVSGISFIHAKLDKNKRYSQDMDSRLNTALTLSANLDQTPKAFIKDLVLSLFDEGCVAVVPTDSIVDVKKGTEDICELRVGKIVEWQPDRVKVEVYNEQTGKKEQIYCPKRSTAIIENPFYAVMNARNSTKERLVHKMYLLDKMDNLMASNKLNLIIQVPYLTKSQAQKQRAQKRVNELSDQLENSPMGIGYSDGTEKIVQLNRPIENSLPEEIKNLQTDLFNQLGMAQAIFDGTATPEQVETYFDNTVEPICDAICDEFSRKFLSSTALTQGQRVIYYRDPFKLTTLKEIADATQYLIPNQVVTPNEIRTGLGLKPSDQPQADTLMNPNINTLDETQNSAGEVATQPEEGVPDEGYQDEPEEPEDPMDVPVSSLY